MNSYGWMRFLFGEGVDFKLCGALGFSRSSLLERNSKRHILTNK